VPKKYYLTPDTNSTIPGHANAAVVMLACNSDLNSVVKSLLQLKAKFNIWFGYLYVLLNEEPSSNEFRQAILELTEGVAEKCSAIILAGSATKQIVRAGVLHNQIFYVMVELRVCWAEV
jgi:hypothetical protein